MRPCLVCQYGLFITVLIKTVDGQPRGEKHEARGASRPFAYQDSVRQLPREEVKLERYGFLVGVLFVLHA